MRNIEERRERYMQDALPTKIGGIAANMARVGSISAWPETQNVAFDLLEESKHFIEWIAMEADIETTGALIELQLQLVLWQLHLDKSWSSKDSRTEIGRRAKEYSTDLLQRSGLLNDQ